MVHSNNQHNIPFFPQELQTVAVQISLRFFFLILNNHMQEFLDIFLWTP